MYYMHFGNLDTREELNGLAYLLHLMHRCLLV